MRRITHKKPSDARRIGHQCPLQRTCGIVSPLVPQFTTKSRPALAAVIPGDEEIWTQDSAWTIYTKKAKLWAFLQAGAYSGSPTSWPGATKNDTVYVNCKMENMLLCTIREGFLVSSHNEVRRVFVDVLRCNLQLIFARVL